MAGDHPITYLLGFSAALAPKFPPDGHCPGDAWGSLGSVGKPGATAGDGEAWGGRAAPGFGATRRYTITERLEES